MPLWANLHGGYVIGLALVAMFAAAQWWDRHETNGPSWRHVIAVGAAGFVLTGINPYTWHIWAYPFTYFYGENASMRLIDEWQSPDFHQLRNAPIAVMLVLAMVAGVNGRRFDAWRTLLMLALGAMALQSMRHAVLFGLAWPVIVGPALAERWEWWRREQIVTRGLPSMNWALLAGTTAAMVAVLFISPRGVPLRAAPTEGALGPPAEAAAVVEREYPGARMFNEYGWGGYLIYRLFPHNQVFIDGRADLHGALVTEYDNAIRGRGWEHLFARYGIELALLRPGVPLASQLRAAGWTVAYEDDRQVLLVAPKDAAPSR
jgi:hypothetical protein